MERLWFTAVTQHGSSALLTSGPITTHVSLFNPVRSFLSYHFNNILHTLNISSGRFKKYIFSKNSECHQIIHPDGIWAEETYKEKMRQA
jgi:hypothetical protein